jgi:8-oxo-dGTP pyrophosphatase MutT (NUDIX family)
MLFDSNLRLCIVKGPKGWSLPGGKPDEGENGIETLMRELHEELGEIALHIKLIDYQTVYFKEGWRNFVWFGYIEGKGNSFLIPMSEIQAIKWIKPKDLSIYSPYWRGFLFGI